MPSLNERERNNVRAGIFVTITLIAALGVLIALTDMVSAISRRTKEYTVVFDVASGVANLKKGSDVRVGGVTMGSVLEVLPRAEEGTAFRTIGIRFNLDQRVTLYDDARIVVSSPILGNVAWLDIPNVGDSGAILPAGGSIAGVPAVGMLSTMLGAANAEKADQLVEDMAQFSRFLAGLDQEYADRYVPIIDGIGKSIDDAREIMHDLRSNRWPTWAASVDHVMTWMTQATAKIDGGLDDGRAAVADTREIISTNKDRINAIVANVQSTTTRIDKETIDKFHTLMDTAQDGLDTTVAVLDRLQTDYEMWSSDVGEALASANLAAQQVKLAMIETRRAPWKILYRPTASELEHELLYDAARSFALAVGDLKTTADAAKRILDNHGDKLKSDENAYRRVEKAVADSLANYENAQQRLLDVLLLDSKPN